MSSQRMTDMRHCCRGRFTCRSRTNVTFLPARCLVCHSVDARMQWRRHEWHGTNANSWWQLPSANILQ